MTETQRAQRTMPGEGDDRKSSKADVRGKFPDRRMRGWKQPRSKSQKRPSREKEPGPRARDRAGDSS